MGKSKRGILGTSIVHGIILAIILLFGFIVPDPPPEEEGIMINFGTDESGFGMEEPMASEISEQATPPPPQEEITPVESSEEIISQDFEEAPAVEPQREVVEQEEVREQPVDKVVEEVEETPPPPVEEPPKVNERALYRGRSNAESSSTSEGSTEGDGNQGSSTGTDSDNYLDGLGGRGINFSLAGRNPLSLPKPDYNVQESGTVVVTIRVNQDGIVTHAEPGAKGTNITNNELWEAARKAALKARFNKSSDAAFTQRGTITYHFVLQ